MSKWHFRSEREKRSTSGGTPKVSNGFSGNFLIHLISNRKFRVFLANGKHPTFPRIALLSFCACSERPTCFPGYLFFLSLTGCGPHWTKPDRSTLKIRSPKVRFKNVLIRPGRKYYFHITCQKGGFFVRSVGIENSSLASFFTVSRLFFAVCCFRLANRISIDA